MSQLPTWLRSGRVVVGLAIVTAIALIAIFAPLLAPHDPNEQNLISTLLPPAWQNGGDAAFPLGTDSLGRCTLSRLIYGARIAMTVAIVASLGAMIIGAVLAHIAGYFGGTLLIEVIYSYPGMGNLMVDAVRNADLPIIQAVGLTYCIMVLAINTVVDGLYLVLNPRLRPR